MDSDDEPENEWPGSLPQQLNQLAVTSTGERRRHDGTLQSRKWLFAPSAVVAGYLLLSFVCYAVDGHFQSNETVGMALMGAVFSSQVVCGCWAAWAPISTIWRLPSALTAAVVLALLGPRPGGDDPIILIIHGAVFVGFFIVFGLGRRLAGWKLTCGQREREPTREQFNLRYLFLLTAIVAGVTTLGKLLVGEVGPVGPANLSTRELIGMLLVTSGVFTLLQAPAAVGFLVPLLGRPRWLILLLALPLLIAATSYASVQVLISTIPVGQTIQELWRVTSTIAAGAAIPLLLAAITLRLGGYRLASGKAGDA